MRTGHLDSTRGKGRKRSPRPRQKKFSPIPSPLAETPGSSSNSPHGEAASMLSDATQVEAMTNPFSNEAQVVEEADTEQTAAEEEKITVDPSETSEQDTNQHVQTCEEETAELETSEQQVGDSEQDLEVQVKKLKAAQGEIVRQEDKEVVETKDSVESLPETAAPASQVSDLEHPVNLELKEKHVVDVSNMNVTLATTPMTPAGKLVDMMADLTLDSADLEQTEMSKEQCDHAEKHVHQEKSLQTEEVPEETKPDRTSDCEHISICSEKSDEQSLESADNEYVTSRGVRFTQHHAKDVAGKPIPHGLPCARELFRFLTSLINSHDK